MSARTRLLAAVLGVGLIGLVTPGIAVALAATTTTLSVSPTSGDSATVFHISATVTSGGAPISGGGEVRITDWTAQSGGSVIWDHTFALNGNGVASPQGIQVDPGTHWWQAEFISTPSFAGSTSTRKSVTVSGLTTTLTDVVLSWSATSIHFGGKGSAGDGAIQLVVDNQVHASCWQWSSAVACDAPNNLAPGSHTALIRYMPQSVRYGSSSSAAQEFWNGPPLPPSTGISIEGDRFAINTLSVNVDVAAGDGSVRLSNTPDVDGAGLLTAGTTFASLPRLPWTLAAGADGWRRVYAQRIAANGAASAVSSDAIFLDTTAPTGSFLIDGGAPVVGDPWSGTVYDQHLTGTASDNSWTVGAAGEITHMAVSNDGNSWWVIAYEVHSHSAPPPPPPGPSPTPSPTPSGAPPIAFSFDVLWQVAIEWWGGDQQPGEHTVYVKWRDEAGNWSAPVTNKVTEVGSGSIAKLLIDGIDGNKPNPAYLSNPNPVLSIHVAYPPEEGLDRVVIRADSDTPGKSVDWPAGASDLVVPWSLTDTAYGYTSGDGVKDVHVELLSNTGRHNYFGGRVILDRSVATSGVPVPAFALGTTVTEQTAGAGFGVSAGSKVTVIPMDIQWKSAGSTVASYDLERMVSGYWNNVSLTKPTATKARSQVSPGITDQYRVQATFASGSQGAWKTGTPFSASIYQDDSTGLTYRGTWTTLGRTDALGSTVRSAKAAGASVKMTFTGRAVAVLAPRTSPGGTYAVYVDGNFIKNVALSSSTGVYQARQIVFSMSWKSSAKHTIKIVKKYKAWTTGFDAFLVLN